MSLAWVGNKYSDISDCNDFFDYSINLYGDNSKNIFSYPYKRLSNNITNKVADNFVLMQIKRLIQSDDNVKFMLYNPCKCFSFGKDIIDKTLCLNDRFLLNILNNKLSCHNILHGIVEMPPYITLPGKDINYSILYNLFNEATQFIVQIPESAGGLGTYIFNESTESDILKKLKPNLYYLISVYVPKNISFNVHMLIEKQSEIIFPPSVQLIQQGKDNLNIFRGSDFINTSEIDSITLDMYLKKIAKILRSLGYIGIIGIDFIQDCITGQIYFIEFNCRFQASTFLLNKALKENQLISVQEMNYNAFAGLKNPYINDLRVNYAAVINYKSASSSINIENAYECSTISDNIENYNSFEKLSYLTKVIYKKI